MTDETQDRGREEDAGRVERRSSRRGGERNRGDRGDRVDHSDRGTDPTEARLPAEARVRDEDLEPFAALRYIARLFKALSILLLVLLVAEVALGLVQAGTAVLGTLLVDATRLLVLAGLLWGIGDLALMLIETNHDLRATRILVGRLQNQLEDIGESLRSGR
jgi:hypothetical protein